MKKIVTTLLSIVLILSFVVSPVTAAGTSAKPKYDLTITFPSDKYPETAAHIRKAIAAGKSAVCTIDRDGAAANRELSLANIPTKKNYDRDEWPMAMCVEGGKGAHVAYVKSSDNRGAGSWVGNKLHDIKNGKRVLFLVPAPKSSTKTSTATTKPKATASPKPKATAAPANVYYKNCTAVRAAGKAPLYVGDPGYSTKLDRDKDGVACE